MTIIAPIISKFFYSFLAYLHFFWLSNHFTPQKFSDFQFHFFLNSILVNKEFFIFIILLKNLSGYYIIYFFSFETSFMSLQAYLNSQTRNQYFPNYFQFIDNWIFSRLEPLQLFMYQTYFQDHSLNFLFFTSLLAYFKWKSTILYRN